MKLIDILLEVLRESKPITLDKDVYPQMDKVYANFLEESKDQRVVAYIEGGGEATLGRIKFKNPYDPSFDGVIVRLVFNEDRNTKGWYNRSTRDVYININSRVGVDKTTFINVLYHELVHAIDPKLTNYKVTNKIYKKLDKDKSDDYIKYLKNPAELDAFSSSFVNMIKDGLELLSDTDKQKAKSALKILVNDLLGLLKINLNTSTDSEIYYDFIDKHKLELNSIKNLVLSSSTANSRGLLEDFLSTIIPYRHKPSLFKKYIQRLSTLL